MDNLKAEIGWQRNIAEKSHDSRESGIGKRQSVKGKQHKYLRSYFKCISFTSFTFRQGMEYELDNVAENI